MVRKLLSLRFQVQAYRVLISDIKMQFESRIRNGLPVFKKTSAGVAGGGHGAHVWRATTCKYCHYLTCTVTMT